MEFIRKIIEQLPICKPVKVNPRKYFSLTIFVEVCSKKHTLSQENREETYGSLL